MKTPLADRVRPTELSDVVGQHHLLDNGKILHCPAFSVKPVDTNGAGDVFHAAFAVRYLETQNLMECMRFASAVSAFKCLKLGGRAGIPNRKDVDEFLKNN